MIDTDSDREEVYDTDDADEDDRPELMSSPAAKASDDVGSNSVLMVVIDNEGANVEVAVD